MSHNPTSNENTDTKNDIPTSTIPDPSPALHERRITETTNRLPQPDYYEE